MILRKIRYIYRSQSDFIDLWLSLVVLVTSIYMSCCGPLEKIIYYQAICEHVSSFYLGSLGIFISSANIIKIFYPKIPPIVVTVRSPKFDIWTKSFYVYPNAT